MGPWKFWGLGIWAQGIGLRHPHSRRESVRILLLQGYDDLGTCYMNVLLHKSSDTIFGLAVRILWVTGEDVNLLRLVGMDGITLMVFSWDLGILGIVLLDCGNFCS